MISSLFRRWFLQRSYFLFVASLVLATVAVLVGVFLIFHAITAPAPASDLTHTRDTVWHTTHWKVIHYG